MGVPRAQPHRALCLEGPGTWFRCSAVTILNFLISFEHRALIPFASGSKNYMAGAGTKGSPRRQEEEEKKN